MLLWLSECSLVSAFRSTFLLVWILANAYLIQVLEIANTIINATLVLSGSHSISIFNSFNSLKIRVFIFNYPSKQGHKNKKPKINFLTYRLNLSVKLKNTANIYVYNI